MCNLNALMYQVAPMERTTDLAVNGAGAALRALASASASAAAFYHPSTGTRIKHGEDTTTNKVCRRAPRAAHERDWITNEIV